MSGTTLVWLRNELRVDDLPALSAAIERGGAVVPVYVLGADDEYGGWAPGAASRWWLHHSLTELSARFEALGSPLIVRSGSTLTALQAVAAEVGADRVHYTSRVEPAARAIERQVCAAMDAVAFPGDLLWDPDEVKTKTGGTYRVFTPFSKTCVAIGVRRPPTPAPTALIPPARPAKTVPIDQLGLLPKIPWDEGLRARWRPGERNAQDALSAWVSGDAVSAYVQGRERPAETGTALLSPHLAFGEISPRRVWHVINARLQTDAEASEGAMAWRRQLIWREFARYLMWHYPHTTDAPLDARYERFPWRRDKEFLRRWRRGQTGYPLVDAAMRQLWQTGWMHNRARMVVASFLVKDGLLDWRLGARWFWDTLVDADLANNTLGWQWAAGCGADAAPFFRVFNPTSQSKRYDPAAVYLHRWLPELSDLGAKASHEPWRAPMLARGYPEPVVDHAAARLRALDVWRSSVRRSA